MDVMHLRMEHKIQSPEFDLAAIDWSLVRSFAAVMRAGNLTRAATMLRTTQPTVGRHIRRLEALTGEILFDRIGTALRPTARASELFERAEALDDAVGAFTRSLRGEASGIRGTVRVTASLVLGTYILPGLLAPLLEAHPGLEIELLVSDRVENLLRREADIAVRFARPEQGDLIARQIGTLSLGLYASRAYLARAGRGIPRSAADLVGHTVVGEEEGLHAPAFGRAHGVEIRKSDIRLRSSSMPAQLAALRAGIGIGPMMIYIAEPLDDLVRILPEISVATLPVWMVAHDDLHRSARLRLVFDHLAESLAEFVD